MRPALNKNTTVCISLSGRPSNHGIKFHNYLYEKHGLDYLYKAMTTTHVATGSILGTGLGRKGAEVRWGVAGRMVVAWVITLPAAAAIGATTWMIGAGLNSLTNTQFVGELVVFAILVVFCLWMWRHSQKDAIDASNVTNSWDGEAVAAAEESLTADEAPMDDSAKNHQEALPQKAGA